MSKPSKHGRPSAPPPTPTPVEERKPTNMENATLRVYDKKTKSEVTEGLTLVPMNGREHIGRKHIAVRNDKGVALNVGILNPDGTVEAQPGYRIEISDGVARNTADADDE